MRLCVCVFELINRMDAKNCEKLIIIVEQYIKVRMKLHLEAKKTALFYFCNNFVRFFVLE